MAILSDVMIEMMYSTYKSEYFSSCVQDVTLYAVMWLREPVKLFTFHS